MAYHGYIPFIENYANKFEVPKILEIGVFTGVTTIALASRFLQRNKKFDYLGIDILIRPDVIETLKYMEVTRCGSVAFSQSNSLEVLPGLVDSGVKFDVVLLDGDHNYYTVSRELPMLDQITHDRSITIIDDYHGKWSTKDLFYADREEYVDVEKKTPSSVKRIGEKSGVKPAVDEFLAERHYLKSKSFMPGEPIVVWHENNTDLISGLGTDSKIY